MKIFFTFLLSLLAGISYSQFNAPVDIKWSDPQKRNSKEYLIGIIGKHLGSYYTLKSAGGFKRAIYLNKHNSNLSLDKVYKFDLKPKKKYTKRIHDVFKLNGKLYYSWVAGIRSKKSKIFFLHEVNSKTLEVNEEVKKLSELNDVNSWKDFVHGHGNFNMVVSRDSSHVLIYSELPTKKNSPMQFKIQVLDNEFNELWAKEIVLPFKEKLFHTKQFQVDNNGNVFISGKLYKEKLREKVKGKPNYGYVILSYKNKTGKQDRYNIDLVDEFVSELTFDILNNGDIVCCGFYSEINSNSLKGTYFFKINTKDQSYYNVNKKAFDFKTITEFIGEKQAKKIKRKNKKAELYSYDMKKLILRSDGGAIMIAEQFFIRTTTVTDNEGRTRTNTHYVYKDIIVVNINPKGNIDWVSRVPKKQTSTNDGGYYSSFATAIVRDKIYLVFNDNEKNLVNTDQTKVYYTNFRKSIITLIQINQKGDVKRFKIGSRKEDSVYVIPKRCKQTSKNELLLYGQKKKFYKLALVTF